MRVWIEGKSKHECDYCKKNFSVTGAPHLSLELGSRSGFSRDSPDDLVLGWRFYKVITADRLDFCLPSESNCLTKFFEAIEALNLPEYTR